MVTSLNSECFVCRTCKAKTAFWSAFVCIDFLRWQNLPNKYFAWGKNVEYNRHFSKQLMTNITDFPSKEAHLIRRGKCTQVTERNGNHILGDFEQWMYANPVRCLLLAILSSAKNRPVILRIFVQSPLPQNLFQTREVATKEGKK